MTLTAILILFLGYTSVSQIEGRKGLYTLKRIRPGDQWGSLWGVAWDLSDTVNFVGRLWSESWPLRGRNNIEPLIQVAVGSVRPTTQITIIYTIFYILFYFIFSFQCP